MGSNLARLLITAPVKQLNLINALFKEIHVDLTEDKILDMFNIFIDAAQRSNRQIVDTDFLVNNTMKLIVNKELQTLLSDDEYFKLFCIVYDTVLTLRDSINYGDLLFKSLYVSEVNNAVITVTYMT